MRMVNLSVGGDEFVVILLGSDYENREKLEQGFVKKVNESTGKIRFRWLAEFLCSTRLTTRTLPLFLNEPMP